MEVGQFFRHLMSGRMAGINELPDGVKQVFALDVVVVFLIRFFLLFRF